MKEFSYEEVEAATGGFAAKNLVGKGSHGSVYKARLRGGGSRTATVAVKRPSHAQGEAKLANEIAVLSAAPRHPGVVAFVGVVVARPAPATAADEGGRRRWVGRAAARRSWWRRGQPRQRLQGQAAGRRRR